MRKSVGEANRKSARVVNRKSGKGVNRKAGKAATALALLPLVAPLLALLLLFAPLARVGAQGSKVRGITPEDYYAFEFVGDPRLSPDGKLVARSEEHTP